MFESYARCRAPLRLPGRLFLFVGDASLLGRCDREQGRDGRARRADEGAGLGQRRRLVQPLRQAEVGHQRRPSGERGV
jgi:hypothetical protein